MAASIGFAETEFQYLRTATKWVPDGSSADFASTSFFVRVSQRAAAPSYSGVASPPAAPGGGGDERSPAGGGARRASGGAPSPPIGPGGGSPSKYQSVPCKSLPCRRGRTAIRASRARCRGNGRSGENRSSRAQKTAGFEERNDS